MSETIDLTQEEITLLNKKFKIHPEIFPEFEYVESGHSLTADALATLMEENLPVLHWMATSNLITEPTSEQVLDREIPPQTKQKIHKIAEHVRKLLKATYAVELNRESNWLD